MTTSPSFSDYSTGSNGQTDLLITHKQLMASISNRQGGDPCYKPLLEEMEAVRGLVARLASAVDVLKLADLEGKCKISELSRRIDKVTGERTPSIFHVPECTICLSNPCTQAAEPCGHVLYCDNCYNAASLLACPICRQRIKGFLRLFF